MLIGSPKKLIRRLKNKGKTESVYSKHSSKFFNFNRSFGDNIDIYDKSKSSVKNTNYNGCADPVNIIATNEEENNVIKNNNDNNIFINDYDDDNSDDSDSSDDSDNNKHNENHNNIHNLHNKFKASIGNLLKKNNNTNSQNIEDEHEIENQSSHSSTSEHQIEKQSNQNSSPELEIEKQPNYNTLSNNDSIPQ